MNPVSSDFVGREAFTRFDLRLIDSAENPKNFDSDQITEISRILFLKTA